MNEVTVTCPYFGFIEEREEVEIVIPPIWESEECEDVEVPDLKEK